MQLEIRDHLLFIDGARAPYRPTPNFGGALVPQGVIVHDTAGGVEAEGSIAWLTDRAAKASAHVVVARDGRITQLAPFNRQTWHAGQSSYHGRPNCNGFTVGIEIVNPGKLKLDVRQLAYVNALAVRIPGDEVCIRQDQCAAGEFDVRRQTTPEHGDGYWLAYTRAQIEAVTALCAAVRAAYPATAFIAPHWFIAPRRKIDTNPRFPLDELRYRTFGGPKHGAELQNSRTIIGASMAGGGGAGLTYDNASELSYQLERADGAISMGSVFGLLIGLVILGGAAVAIYARWDDAGRPLPSFVRRWLERRDARRAAAAPMPAPARRRKRKARR